MTAYRSIFLAADWRHVRYLGWSDHWPTPDMRVLTKRAGPIARSLVVSTERDVATVIREVRSRIGFNAEVTVRDLARLPGVETALRSLSFAEVDVGRMLNRYTSVIDLRRDEPALLAAMKPDTRRLLRAAARAAIDCRAEAEHDPALLDLFFETLNDLSHTHGLQAVDREETRRQFADGTSHLYAATADGDGSAFLQTYEAGDTAIFLHGATAGRSEHGLVRALHWFAIRDMRARGLHWYDLGGLPSLDPQNGITRFKAAFGGDMIDLGPEYRWQGPLAVAARRGRSAWRRWARARR